MKESKGERQKGAREFEELHVYQQARALPNRIYSVTANSAFQRDLSLREQLRRAAFSILSNIAEGFERGTNAAFAHALAIAKGLCGELRAQMAVAFDQKYVGRQDYTEMVDDCRRLSGGLANLRAYLKRSRSESQSPSRPTR